MATLEVGGQELLAVGNYTAAADAGIADAEASAGVIVSGPLPLPYSLPD